MVNEENRTMDIRILSKKMNIFSTSEQISKNCGKPHSNTSRLCNKSEKCQQLDARSNNYYTWNNLEGECDVFEDC